MRITQQRLIEEATRNISAHLERLQRIQAQVASGKRIRRPEDDPLGTMRALDIRSSLNALEATQRNLDLSRDWLAATEAALKDLNDLLSRARELAARAANEPQMTSSYASWAAEVDQLVEEAVQVGNMTHRGLYVFSGRKVTTRPFERTGPSTIVYQGDGGAIEHPVEEGERIQVNIPGDHPLFTRTFDALTTLRQRLVNGDSAGARASIEELDQAMDAVSQALTTVGARVKRVESTQARLSDLEVELRSLLSETEDADMAEALMDLSVEDRAYRALLAASSRLLGPTLFDYLR